MAKYVMVPRAKFARGWWNHQLIPLLSETSTDVEDDDHADFVSPIPQDKERRAAKMDGTPWAFTVNEHRAVVDLPPREDGEVYMRPPEMQLMPIEAMPVEGEAQERAVSLPDDTIVKVAVTKQPDEAQRIAEALEPEQLEVDLKPEVDSKIRQFALSTFDEFPVMVDESDVFFVLDPKIQDYVDNFAAQKIVDINETTREQVRDLVGQGLREGVNPRSIRGEIGEYVDDIIPNRGEVIARTEMVGAQNFARHETMEASGVVEFEKWLATIDGRERGAHALLDGMVVELGENFVVPSGEFSGESAPHPGAFGVAELDIQCRCATRAYFPEIDDLIQDGMSFERAVKHYFGARFKINRDAILDDSAIIKRVVKQQDDAFEEFGRAVERSLTRQIQEYALPKFDELFAGEL